MGRTRRTVRVTILFGSLALSMATLPALLGKIDSVRSVAAGQTGSVALPSTDGATSKFDGLLPDMELIGPGDGAGYDPRAILEHRAEADREAKAPKPRGVTRVLGPED